MPLIGDVKISIGDADILVTDTGETYWIKSAPDFKEKPDSSVVFGRWYYQGDQDSEYAIILTLNEDGTYTRVIGITPFLLAFYIRRLRPILFKSFWTWYGKYIKTANIVITIKYILINKSRLLMRPRFVYYICRRWKDR